MAKKTTTTVAPGLPVVSRDPRNFSQEADFDALFRAFSSDVPSGNPPTPDWIEPYAGGPFRHFTRAIDTSHDVDMPDGEKVRFWVFHDPNGPRTFPSTPIRVTEGDIVHCLLLPSKRNHTIHWHGIEPTPANDGVGKLSFEVNDRYVYQWYAGSAGTYFYHCHRNTVLHFEMGMYGMLIVDPRPDPSDPPGTKRAFAGGPRYDVEAIWASDDVDPRWRELNHSAGLGYPFGEDAGLNRFEPKYFLISGVPHPWSRNLPTDPRRPGVAATVRVGQTLLVRLVCAGFSVHRYSLLPPAGGVDPLEAEVVAVDGRPLGQKPYTQYSRPWKIYSDSPFSFTAAQRHDLIVTPTEKQVGVHTFRVEYRHFVTGEIQGIAETVIHVLPEDAPVAPVANNDLAATAPGVPVLIDVLANDTPRDRLDPATVIIRQEPEHGMAAVNPEDGLVTYTPEHHFTGTDSFTYTVKDLDAVESNEALVSVQVVAETFVVHGLVTDQESGEPVGGVALALSLEDGTVLQTSVTSLDGRYHFHDGVPAGTYLLIPSQAGRSFDPASAQIVVSADYEQNFVRLALTATGGVAGTVRGLSGAPVAGVTVKLFAGGAEWGSAVTGADGSYALASVPPGTYSVQPMQEGFSFSPEGRTVEVGEANVAGVDFTRNDARILGRVRSRRNVPLADVIITVTGGASVQAVTRADGTYEVGALGPDRFVVTPELGSMVFNPASRTITIKSKDATGQDFKEK
jgi:FtsP/CotA-like multicopper oxidase with cupredoxin domain